MYTTYVLLMLVIVQSGPFGSNLTRNYSEIRIPAGRKTRKPDSNFGCRSVDLDESANPSHRYQPIGRMYPAHCYLLTYSRCLGRPRHTCIPR